VIGVVADHRDRQRAARVPTAYVRYPRAGALYTTTYAVRTASDPVQVIPMVRRIVAEAGASVEGDVTTGTSYRDRTMTRERLLASLLGSFASVALVLCALGIYGLLSYTTSWRTAEIGVRVALGASRRQVVLLVLWDSLVPMVVGVAIGGAAAAALTRGLAALLFEVSPTDRWTWSMAAALLVLVSVAAAAAPSLRAARTDPAQALKWD
jgi:ABC-type antimicrobial peptide transport system permease subunit